MGFGLYIHIPFCVRKCAYCDFLSFTSGETARRAYTDALITEITLRGEALRRMKEEVPSDRPVTSVFLGGGTPTVLEADCLQKIFEAVHTSFDLAEDAEITIEMNPGTDRADLDPVLKRYVNRVSVGLQSFQDKELKSLGRIHTSADFLRTYDRLRRLGIANINIDLMYALPGQTPASYRDTLEKTCRLRPEHISAYSLIIEDGTPFAELNKDGELDLPDEETERGMDELTEALLADYGYHRYEISNYAQPGRESQHNCLYWTGQDYLGLGLGASSLMSGVRFRNTDSLPLYLDLLGKRDPARMAALHLSEVPWAAESHILTRREQMEEFLFLGLRLTRGISAVTFENRFNLSLDSVCGDVIARHVCDGLIRRTPDGIALTKRGRDVSNVVLAGYLLDEPG